MFRCEPSIIMHQTLPRRNGGDFINFCVLTFRIYAVFYYECVSSSCFIFSIIHAHEIFLFHVKGFFLIFSMLYRVFSVASICFFVVFQSVKSVFVCCLMRVFSYLGVNMAAYRYKIRLLFLSCQGWIF